MRSVGQFALVAGVAALLASPILAQQRQGGGRFMGFGMPTWRLVTQKSVQDELKLSEDQIKKADELARQLGEKQREAFQSLQDLEPAERGKKMATALQEMNKANEKAVADILKPEQMKRLKQISYQRQRTSAFTDPDVAKALQLTDAQKKEIQQINQDMFAQVRDLFQQGGPADDETRKKVEDLRKTTSEKVMGLLTSEQKEKWKQMTGAPFKGEIRFGPPGGRGPGG